MSEIKNVIIKNVYGFGLKKERILKETKQNKYICTIQGNQKTV